MLLQKKTHLPDNILAGHVLLTLQLPQKKGLVATLPRPINIGTKNKYRHKEGSNNKMLPQKGLTWQYTEWTYNVLQQH